MKRSFAAGTSPPHRPRSHILQPGCLQRSPGPPAVLGRGSRARRALPEPAGGEQLAHSAAGCWILRSRGLAAEPVHASQEWLISVRGALAFPGTPTWGQKSPAPILLCFSSCKDTSLAKPELLGPSLLSQEIPALMQKLVRAVERYQSPSPDPTSGRDDVMLGTS